VPDSKQPTAPPPFDPAKFARSTESALKDRSAYKVTTTQVSAPPLNKRVRLAVPEADLAWIELSAEAQALIKHMDGTTTLMEMMETIPSPQFLRAVAELHDAKLLAYEESAE
jgi:hypothetical protein